MKRTLNIKNIAADDKNKAATRIKEIETKKKEKEINEERAKNFEKGENTKKKIDISDAIMKFLEMDFDNYDIDGGELDVHMSELAPKGEARNKDELKIDADKKFKEALKTMKFAVSGSPKFVLTNDDKSIEECGPIPIEVNVLKATLFDFAFIYGNYNEKRKWIKILNTQTFISFPELISNKGHTTFVVLFCDKISEKLMNTSNALIKLIEKREVKIREDRKKYLFSKGHLMSDEHRDAIIKDLNEIFKQLKKPVNERRFDDLKFFKQ